MNSNLKFIFFIEANVKAYVTIFFVFLLLLLLLLLFYLFYVLLVSQNPGMASALLPKRLFFRSTIMKAWHRLWARWRKDTQERQFTGIHLMVQCLALMSTLLIMPTVTTTQEHVWAFSTLFHLQCGTSAQSWPAWLGTSHLMRWRYFIFNHPAKCKITQTIIFITVKSEGEAMGSLI